MTQQKSIYGMNGTMRACRAASVLLVTGLVGAFAYQQDVHAQDVHAQDAISEVTVEHTACYGPCPVYKVTLRRDGTAAFIGSAHVDKVGAYTASVSGFARLARAIERRDFEYFKARYAGPMTDRPHILTTIVQSGRHKTVDNYADAGPQELWEIQALVDGAAAEARWQKVNVGPAHR